jgi:hypothetical protein
MHDTFRTSYSGELHGSAAKAGADKLADGIPALEKMIVCGNVDRILCEIIERRV